MAVLQNGVEHRELVEPLAGPARVLPAIVWCPSEAIAPGRVRQRGPARLSVPDDPAGAALAGLLDGAAQVDVVPDFRTEAWRKLCLNAVAAPMVLAGRRAEVYREPGQLELARGLAEECVAVGRAEGARVGPGTVEEVMAEISGFPPDMGTSMLFDRLAGRPLEWDARNGVISRLGSRHGIPTPVNDEVVARLAAIDAAGRARLRARDRGSDQRRRRRAEHGARRRPAGCARAAPRRPPGRCRAAWRRLRTCPGGGAAPRAP